jgi:GTP cyclohydrolase I
MMTTPGCPADGRCPPTAPAPASREAEAGRGDRLPDVANHALAAAASGTLDRVGMRGIAVAVRLRDATGMTVLAPAVADAAVSLDHPAARGIHMSRLFLALEAILAEEDLGPLAVQRLLQAFVGTHAGISSTASVRLSFQHLVRRRALVSHHEAWRAYPVSIGGEIADGRMSVTLGARVTYSSTCPCSAALARQANAERFLQDFAGEARPERASVAAWLASERGMAAVPHGQRSHADVLVRLAGDGTQGAGDLVALIDLVEAALGTAVQAAVKRADEQEFARLNAEHLMFCEDAGRRVKAALLGAAGVADFRVEIAHLESLHDHDAVCVVTKGVPGGFTAAAG